MLAIGCAEVPWVLRSVRDSLANPPPPFVNWNDFIAAPRGLFLFEAFVSGDAKTGDHIGDARAAVAAFESALPDPTTADALLEPDVFSLLGAALLRTGWSDDLELLAMRPLVIRPL